MSAERGILFSGPMVRAILDGRKTQTRRVVKLRGGLDFLGGSGDDLDDPVNWGFEDRDGQWWQLSADDGMGKQVPCPYGEPGDLLYVRETWTADFGTTFSDHPQAWWHEMPKSLRTARAVAYLYFRADGAVYHGPYHGADPGGARLPIVRSSWEPNEDDLEGMKWKPSIHMPKRFARIWLRVTDVRVERVQEISAEDARSEGVEIPRCGCEICATGSAICPADASEYLMAFAQLWDSINAKRGYGWDTNPWVWVVTFEREER